MYSRHAIRKDVTEDVNYMTDIKPYRNPKRSFTVGALLLETLRKLLCSLPEKSQTSINRNLKMCFDKQSLQTFKLRSK